MCLNVNFIPLVVDDTFAIFLQSGSVSVEASWASYRLSVEVRLMVCSLLMIFLELKKFITRFHIQESSMPYTYFSLPRLQKIEPERGPSRFVMRCPIDYCSECWVCLYVMQGWYFVTHSREYSLQCGRFQLQGWHSSCSGNIFEWTWSSLRDTFQSW